MSTGVRAVRRLAGRGLRTAKALLDAAVFPLAGAMPRRADTWVFGHEGNHFAGNPKFLYLWLARRGGVRVWWISGSAGTVRMLKAQGLPAALRWSPRGMFHTLTAGAAFFAHRTSDVNGTLLNGAYLVNLWHGVGLKAIQFGHATGRTASAGLVATNWLQRSAHRTYVTTPDIVVTTSPMMQAHFADQFRLDPERCPMLGYPRLDCARDAELAQASIAFDATQPFDELLRRHARLIVYVPTFRDASPAFLDEAFPDLARLDAALERSDSLLLVKLHPKTRQPIDERYRRIVKWPAGVDIQNHLHLFHALITDYSSILYDYLEACAVPTPILYTFDLERYVTSDRSLMFPFEENTAGIRVHDFDALCGVLANRDARADPAEIEAVRARFWGEHGVVASRRIADHVAARVR